MNDAIYSYVKRRLEAALERCEWTDQVGVLFSQNTMPQINETIKFMQNVSYEIDDFLKNAERELNEK